MRIEFVNHSSFIVEQEGVSIICDPWLEGSVFNNGWSLISETKFSYEDFGRINYIWFSHEHPDHFYPPNLKKIPVDIRKNITVLFQNTIDKRVVEFCKKAQFKSVEELHPNQWKKIGNDFQVMCEHFSEGDSWICYKNGNTLFLNTNDCGIMTKERAEELLKKIGGHVDVLFTQFSYAYWAGNPEDIEMRQNIADKKLQLLKLQCDVFKPKVVVPIASYIYFSHIENNYLNDCINTPRKTFEFISNNTNSSPVILYNGDVYDYPTVHDSLQSIKDYEQDFKNIQNNKIYNQTASIPIDQLEIDASIFLKEMNRTNWFYLKKQLSPTNIFVKDYNTSYNLSLKGFVKNVVEEKYCDVSLTSENLKFCFMFSYGLDTTQVNGRLTRPREGSYRNFYNFFRINQLKSRGINPNNLLFLVKAVFRKVFKRSEYHELLTN